MSKSRLTPRRARTFSQIAKLPRDNYDSKRFWMLLNQGSICLTKQTGGEESTAEIELPRWLFDRMVDWYNGKRAKKAKK